MTPLRRVFIIVVLCNLCLKRAYESAFITELTGKLPGSENFERKKIRKVDEKQPVKLSLWDFDPLTTKTGYTHSNHNFQSFRYSRLHLW